MDTYRKQVKEAFSFIKSKSPAAPSAGILTGTGLSNILDTIENPLVLDYSDIPHFPVSTADSHTGQLVLGDIGGRPVMALQGRFHLYEGYSPRQVTFPVRVMQQLGVETLILSNAAGGICPGFEAGQIMIISDHINLTGQNPLTGPNEDDWGLRFPDMTKVYDKELAGIARSAADSLSIPVQKGVYAGLTGPSLETPSETRFLRTIGADAVGFSTIMEAIAGVHAGMRILGLSLITNINDPDNPEPTTLEGVLETARKTVPSFTRLLHQVLLNLPG